MVTKEQFIGGIYTYIEEQVIPVLSTGGKWMLGTIMTLATTKIDSILNMDILKQFDIIDKKGMIDIESVATAIKQAADKYGKLSLSFPVIGTLAFTSDDVDILKEYINGSN